LFKERGEQVEESPLTLVEILSRDHGATPFGVAPAVRLQYTAQVCRPLFDEGLRVIFRPLDEHPGHRPAASAVVVDETTGRTSDFPRSDRDRSGSGVGCGLVAAFDGKAVAAFGAQESVVPAGFSHGRSPSAVPRVSASAWSSRHTIASRRQT
jgi:hypothetical protein